MLCDDANLKGGGADLPSQQSPVGGPPSAPAGVLTFLDQGAQVAVGIALTLRYAQNDIQFLYCWAWEYMYAQA